MISRITRQGLPAAKTPSGMSRVTTLPAPITALCPIRTPGKMIAPPPTQTSDPKLAGLRTLLTAQLGVQRMHRSVDLDRRAKEGEAADVDRTDVEHDAVEVEENPLSEVMLKP